MVNRPAFLLAFGFPQESYIVSLILFVYFYINSLDVILRLGLNWFSRYQEWQADMYAVQQGYGEEL